MSTQAISHPISDNLYLVQQQLPVGQKASTKTPKKDDPVNHIAVIDCSGSMWNDLPKIREQLKKRIPKLLKEEDTLSIIWFSGRGQFGTLLEAEPVATLTELQEVNNAIDRFLKPVFLTGFKEPIQEAKKVIGRISKKNKNPFAMIFMSDGWDNQWDRSEILAAVEDTAGGLNSTTIVEYGNYADRNMLTKMAEKAGGTLIFAGDFNSYAPIFEAAVSKTVSGASKIEIKIEGDSIGGFAFSLGENELISYEVVGNTATVSEDLGELWYLSTSVIGTKAKPIVDIARAQTNDSQLDAVYAAVSLFSVRMQPKVVLPLLSALGDVKLIEQFGGCFGKQAYSDFMAVTQTAAFQHDTRWEQGFDPDKIPPDDAFTVLDFLRVLNSDDSNRVLLDSGDFKYNLIGRKREDITEDKDGNEIVPLKFKVDTAEDGYSVSNLTFNETRPNVSILIRKEGTVDLTQRLKGSGFKKIPKKFSSFIFRNYAIIRDGIVNVELLPVRMTGGTVRQLVEAGFPMSAVEGVGDEDRVKAITRVKKASSTRPVNFVVNLLRIPVINRNMVKETSALALFEAQHALLRARGRQKVLNGIKKEKFARESEGFKVLYGEDGAAWLKDQGITDYSGFGPKTKTAEAQDFYMGKELKIALKGISSLPSFKDARKKIAAGKGVTARYKLMVPAFDEIEEFEDSKVFKNAKNQDKVYKAWLDDQADDAKAEARRLLYITSQIRFSVIVGQTWFTEFDSLEDNTLTISPDGSDIEATVDLNEIQVNV